jgi:hypothetical protein
MDYLHQTPLIWIISLGRDIMDVVSLAYTLGKSPEQVLMPHEVAPAR